MKIILTYLSVALLFAACNKQTQELSKVESFIEKLQGESEGRFEAADFTKDDISELMKYRNEEAKVSNFPRNPLSSFYLEEVSIGMYVLWLIEGLRMEAIQDPGFYQFASLNPRVARVSGDEELDQDGIRADVSTAYLVWWTSSLSEEAKLKTNPLDGLDLMWN